MILENKGNKYSTFITSSVTYALGIICIYGIYMVEMLCNDVPCNISLPKSTFKDTTKLAMMGWYLYTVVVAEVIVISSSLATPLTVAHQAPLSMGFPKQEYWSGLPFPSPVDLPNLHLLNWQR